jgi:hypothetical protein
MLPFLVIIESYGLSFLLSRKIHFYFFFLFFFIFVLNFIYYLHLYYVHSKFSLSTYYRNGGAIELSQLINRLVNDYDFVIFTNHPDNPYPWLMFFGSVYPSNFLSSYHQLTDGSFQYQKFIFTQQRCPSQTVFSQYRQFKLLVVDGEGCELNPKLIKEVPVSFLTTVRRLDNSPPYLLWQN